MLKPILKLSIRAMCKPTEMKLIPVPGRLKQFGEKCKVGAGVVSLGLLAGFPVPVPAGTSLSKPDPNYVEFGLNVGPFAYDGKCDDPRFKGPGMADNPTEQAVYQDAADCRAAYAKRKIWIQFDFGDVDLGDDSGHDANDGKCDDPRFEGTRGMAESPEVESLGRDRSDCVSAYIGRTIRLTLASELFGDDSGHYANDGECDDPRFEGTVGMAESPDIESLGRDRSDCMYAVLEKSIAWIKTDVPGTGIMFGGNGSNYAYNGECDDPRFTGIGVSGTAGWKDVEKDAVDCWRAVKEARATLKVTATPEVTIWFGDDNSILAFDGECDDPRFEGDGMAKSLYRQLVGHDATDCTSAFLSGRITRNPDYNWSQLLDAVISEDVEMVKSELANGADPNKGSKGKNTPLIWAAWTNNRSEIVHLLIGYGADPALQNDFGLTPLNAAAWNDKTDEFIDALTTVEVANVPTNKDRCSPLHGLASVSENPKTIRKLVNFGANVNARTRDGWTPLHQAAYYNETPGIASALIKIGADLNPQDNEGRTPLYQATANNNVQAVEEILEGGADPNLGTEDGDTPLLRAIMERNRFTCEILSKYAKKKEGTNEEDCEF
ncbi:MAG: ankyrin repeat domain-containing protein [Rhodobacteraceae bacterium]|nr:ankyrin repeat domain-containing protein [Paracoccaceae bacterium]